ncbi:MAG TPA: hypothetical protein VF281_02120 [Candidatus Saccharimonadales bacterium]
MNKNNLQTDTSATQIKPSGLPDRSDLSKLYFTPKQSTVTIDKKPHILDDTHLSDTIRAYALKIGLLIPLPFLIAIIPASLFVIAVTQATLFAALPLMIVCGVSAVLVYKKVRILIDRLSLPSFTFLCLQISCMMLIVPSIYYLSELVPAVLWLRLTIICILILTTSSLFCWLFLQLMLNDTLTNKTRARMISTIITICLISALTYLAINLV